MRYGWASGKSAAPMPMPPPQATAVLLKTAVGVFLAGGLGALGRVTLSMYLDRLASHRLAFAGTLAVNLIGCLLIGVLAPLLTGSVRIVVLGGLLGGFTTYSAFALLSAQLAATGRGWTLASQIALHLVGGLAAVALGLWAGRALGGRWPPG